jgi:AmmeMemoRadiSam system protein B
MLVQNIRPAAVAGRFYPSGAAELERMVEGFLEEAPTCSAENLKAVVAPHAGYVFSGPIAGSSFRIWSKQRGNSHRVVLLGPSHFVDFPGIALPGATAFRTPLGSVSIDGEGVEKLRALPQVHEFPAAHEREHCLEVELPFLQRVIPDLTIIPLVIGEASDEEVREAIETLWGGDETRIVVSSDLSHYHDYQTAKCLDQATAAAIESGRPEQLSAELACGYRAIRGLLLAAKPHGLVRHTLDLRNSGDTAGPRHSVVGYGAFGFAETRS